MPRDRSSLVTFSARADVQAQIDSFFDGDEPVFAVESERPPAETELETPDPE